ncbi:MAG: hypothetical protein H6814_06065 [Phycisphaeraceae bacterium]|nr:hypothetical protein [Phycisphaeraceae bacterium]
MALLLALTASVATAAVIDNSDPARLDRREAPRELTVRWLTDAVARAARDLASTEKQPGAQRIAVQAPTFAAPSEPVLPVATREPGGGSPNGVSFEGWPDQGLINLPPPAQR